MTITLTVAGRIASVDATTHVVAGNTYPVALSLDSEWTGSLYLRVRFGSLYYDIPFASSDASVDVQMPVGYPEVGIGVFSEALEICSCEARIRLLRSILEAGEQVVEFDSDLYDQWAGEVSELLCDDSFDSTSDRPVKNSVITAWKDTVPLDSALVHKTGSESVDGTKTFNAGLFAGGTTPLLHLRSTGASTSSAWRGVIRISDKNGSADSDIVEARIVSGGTGSSNSLEVYGAKPDRSSKMLLLNGRAYADHCALLTTPYYPVDGSSNPQALTANALMASGNIAVDPRLVHTTGAESIAGDKTLSGTFSLARADPTVNFKSSTTTAQTGVKANIVFYTSNTVRGQVFQQRDASTEFIALRQQKLVGSGFSELKLRVDSNDVGWAECPSYTADQYADAKIVTRAMLATTPTVVHTTGAETVAGNKTFSGQVSFDKPIGQMAGFVANLAGWTRIYEVTSHQNGGNIRIHADPAVSAKKPTEAQLYVSGNAGSMSFIEIARDFDVSIVAVRRASDKHIEIWCRGAWALWSVPFLYRHNVAHGDNAYSETAPAVGSTYDMIATFN